MAKDKKLIKSSVKASIIKLLSEAQNAARAGNKERSRKYVKMVMDLVKKNKVPLTAQQKTVFCRKCHVLWVLKETLNLVYDNKHNLIRAVCICGHVRKI